tara:strand:+ start:6005 stop:7639 length:1635 start_codon:yes stop_codon:yes gene_type:complete
MIPFGFLKQPVSGLYNDVSAMYTLRRPSTSVLWTNAVLKLRRSSDNQTAFIFIDGNSINDTISLSSFVSTTSNTTPGANQLSSWVGANDAFVEEWIGITPNNIIDGNKTATQTTISSQPQFISSGVIITKNGEPTIDFLSDLRYLQAPVNTDLNNGNNFTLLTVSNNNVITTGVGTILQTTQETTGDNNRVLLFNDNRTNKKSFRIITPSGNAEIDLLLQQNSTNQKVLSLTVNGLSKLGTSYFNSNLQTSDNWGSLYINDGVTIGTGSSGTNFINGTIQEITIFPSDKTADLTELNTDINDYYSIYAPTENLLLYQRFNNSVVDETGLNTPTQNAVSYVNGLYSGLPNESIYYNASVDYVEVPNNSRFNFGNGLTDLPFSITFAIKLTSDTLLKWLLAKRGAAGNSATKREWQVLTDTGGGGKIRIDLQDESTGGFIGVQGNTGLIVNQVYHVTITYNGSGAIGGLKIYIDSVEESSYTDNSSGSYIAMEVHDAPLRSGSQLWSTTSNSANTQFTGLGIWNIELNQGQINDIYNKQSSGQELL